MAHATKLLSKKFFRRLGICFLIILVVTNLPPVNSVLIISFDAEIYRYSNFYGSFTFQENLFKNTSYEQCCGVYDDFLSTRPNVSDKKLYRLFKINPFAIWRWRQYIFEDRYHIPWLDWEKVVEKRGEILNSTPYMDF